MAQVAFLLGKRPKASTIFPEVFTRLADSGVAHSVHLPHDGVVDHDVVRAADLVVHRGLDARAIELVADLHAGGVPLVNAYPRRAAARGPGHHAARTRRPARASDPGRRHLV